MNVRNEYTVLEAEERREILIEMLHLAIELKVIHVFLTVLLKTQKESEFQGVTE